MSSFFGTIGMLRYKSFSISSELSCRKNPPQKNSEKLLKWTALNVSRADNAINKWKPCREFLNSRIETVDS